MPDFILPELGENVASGDVLRILVKPGDTITKDQPVLELETDKATIEVPSSVAGKVTAVKVKTGDKVVVGQVILSVEAGAATGNGASAEKAAAPPVRFPRLTGWPRFPKRNCARARWDFVRRTCSRLRAKSRLATSI